MIFFGFFGYLADLCLYLSIAFFALFSLSLQTSPLAIAFFAFPMIVYTILIIRSKRWVLPVDAIRARLKLLLIVLPVLLFFTMISRSQVVLTQVSLPFYFVTLFTLFMLLRLLRHENPSELPKKYYALNALSLVIISLIAMALSSRVFLNAVFAVLSWLYLHIIGPAFVYLAYAIVYGFVSIWNLIASLFHFERTLEVPDNPVNTIQNNEFTQEPPDVTGAPAWVNILFIVLGLALFAALVYFVARRLAMGRDTAYSGGSTLAQSEPTPPGSKKQPSASPSSRTPRNRVRHYFRKLLRLCRKRGLLSEGSALSKGLSSEKACAIAETLAVQAEASATTSDADSSKPLSDTSGTMPRTLSRLRHLYLPARYSPETEITPEMAEEAQAVWRELKKEIAG